MKRTAVLLFLLSGLAGAQPPAAPLTLERALELALTNNRALAIATARTDETRGARKAAESNYYPQVTNSSTYLHMTQTEILRFSQGSFGTFPDLGSLPSTELIVKQGNPDHFLVRNQVAQPVTQLFRIREGARIARADEAAAHAGLDQLRNRIVLKTRQLYMALVAAQLDRTVAEAMARLAEQEERETREDVARGAALAVQRTEARTKVLQARQDELRARMRQRDLMAQFDDVTGLEAGTAVTVEIRVPAEFVVPPAEECRRLAEEATPEIRAARETVRKAEAGVRAGKYEYIPDVSVFARHDYQNGVAFLFHNYGVVGAEMKYKLFDGGRRRAVIGQREAQLRQARENLRRLQEEAAAQTQVALDKIEESRGLVELAAQVAALRTEAAEVTKAQFEQEAVLASKVTEAEAALLKARAELTKAQLAQVEAQAELQVVLGRMPR